MKTQNFAKKFLFITTALVSMSSSMVFSMNPDGVEERESSARQVFSNQGILPQQITPAHLDAYMAAGEETQYAIINLARLNVYPDANNVTAAQTLLNAGIRPELTLIALVQTFLERGVPSQHITEAHLTAHKQASSSDDKNAVISLATIGVCPQANYLAAVKTLSDVGYHPDLRHITAVEMFLAGGALSSQITAAHLSTYLETEEEGKRNTIVHLARLGTYPDENLIAALRRLLQTSFYPYPNHIAAMQRFLNEGVQVPNMTEAHVVAYVNAEAKDKDLIVHLARLGAYPEGNNLVALRELLKKGFEKSSITSASLDAWIAASISARSSVSN